MGINVNKTDLIKYIKTSAQQNSNELSLVNSIFDEYDKYDERGQEKPDGQLTNDEFKNFMQKADNALKSLVDKFLKATNAEYAEKAKQNSALQPTQQPQVCPTECSRTKEEQKEYIKTLQTAKSILITNKDTLELSEEEVKYIESIGIESITQGPGRYDRIKNRVFFNINDQNPPNVGNFVKIIMHEVTHAVKRKEPHTQAQELACENRGLEVASALHDQYDNFVIYGTKTQYWNLSDVLNPNNREEYLNEWIKNYNHLPKE